MIFKMLVVELIIDLALLFSYQSCCKIICLFICDSHCRIAEQLMYVSKQTAHEIFLKNILQGFEKFIRILVLQKTPRISQDVHVEPFWKRCDMCNLNYDIIGKMETFTKDSNYILENTGMNASKINVEEKVDWLLSLLRFEFQAGRSYHTAQNCI